MLTVSRSPSLPPPLHPPVLLALGEKFGIRDGVTLELLAGAKDLIVAKEGGEDVEPYWQEMVPILKQSLEDMDRMKRAEGETLARDLQQRLDRISTLLGEIRTKFPSSLKGYQERFEEKVRLLLNGSELEKYSPHFRDAVERRDYRARRGRPGAG